MKKQVMPAIDIALKPSFMLFGALLLLAMLACIAVIIVAIPFAIKLFLLTIIIFSTVYYSLRDALYLLPWSWQRVQVTSLGQLRLTNQRGQQFTPDLHATCFIHPLLIILNTSIENLRTQRLPAVLLFSQANDKQHRRLRVWLRWWQHDSTSTAIGSIMKE